jgi:hypothetical protein
MRWWAARRGADGSARSRRGAGMSRVREQERAQVGTTGRGIGFLYRRGEVVRAAEKYLGRHCVRRPRFMARWSLPTDESQLIS